MSYSITGTTIKLTRGDTFACKVKVLDQNGDPYEPKEGDTFRFALKRSYYDSEPLLVKDIPTDTMILRIESHETKNLDFGTYVYDIQLTTAAGDVDTFITKARLRLTEEVD